MTECGHTEELVSPAGHGEHPPPTPQADSRASDREATANLSQLSTTETTQHVQPRLPRDNSSQAFSDANESGTNADQGTPSLPLVKGAPPAKPDRHQRDSPSSPRAAQPQQGRHEYRPMQPPDYRQISRPDLEHLYSDMRRKYTDAKKTNQHLINAVHEQKRIQEDQARRLDHQSKDLKEYSRQIEAGLAKNQSMAAEIERLRHSNDQLTQQNGELKVKCNKNAERYRELDKEYRDLMRNIQVTDDDHSTIYQRLTNIRTTIENLIQKARRSGSMNKELAVEHFRKSGRSNELPILEANLERYNLDLYMESAVMLTLIDNFFLKPLGRIFGQAQGFEVLRNWVAQKDKKVAARWRQQLCVLVDQDDVAKKFKEDEILRVAGELRSLVYKVYTNVDMESKILGLSRDAFDLSFAMYGMEHEIYPFVTPIGTPFDDETMNTPQSSNPDGKVSLLVFPAFKDDIDLFKIPPKVWCL
ncbi:hypothetical protein BGZ80_005175 [Entomortierella chlamydospora]|uniref:Uncharacterized protein n=1 Tax=Entomortierella chlamydospora TaxID=101097 RepID=A0A9P6MZQ3_9FUNG|nr:hypothetical protein BGZ79_011130 [Entomortierella chlamydospora]KAG0019850.1 hypothetical protein BGZ80_005175 [Entomortierella chlamydospora]